MKAMILAAGRGERMRPLTDHMPKPMLKINGVPLIEHHITRLQRAGITEIVVNTAWQAQHLVDYLKDGSELGVSIQYSHEAQGALETAGGIANALPLFVHDDEPFLVVNGDVFTDIDFTRLPSLRDEVLAHLYLVKNPQHHPEGDFSLSNDLVFKKAEHSDSYTYSGVALFRSSFFASCLPQQRAALGPLLRSQIDNKKVTGQLWQGCWTDVGTPERLASLQSNDKAENQ